MTDVLEFVKKKLAEKKEKKYRPILVTNYEIYEEYPIEERAAVKEELRRLCRENILIAGRTINGWYLMVKE